MRVWDAESGALLRCLHGHEFWVESVAWSAIGRRLASGSRDMTVRVWDAECGTVLHCLRGHEDGVASVAWSADGCRFASRSSDQTVRVWNADSGQCLQVLEGHDVVSAITEGREAHPFNLFVLRWESVIRDAYAQVAYHEFPLWPFVTHRTALRWAGARARHLQIIALEGGADVG